MERTLTPTERKWVKNITTDPTLWHLCLTAWVAKMGADAGKYLEDFLLDRKVDFPSYLALEELREAYEELDAEHTRVFSLIPEDMQDWLDGLSVQGRIVVEETLRGLKEGGVL